MSHGQLRDIGAYLSTKAVAGGSLTAAGTGDATEVTSGAIDRKDFASAVLALCGRTTAANGETLKFTVKIADSDDGVSFSSDTTLLNAVTVVAGAVSAQFFAYELDLDLFAYKRYLRFKLTPDLSAAGTDVAAWGAALVLGGANVLPA